MLKICTSANCFVDTNVVLRHANGATGIYSDDIQVIFDEAATGKRQLWFSTILFAELRPSSFVPGKFATVSELARYVRSIATVVAPDPNIALRAARLRDCKWQRPVGVRMKDERSRSISLGDALHISSALFIKEAFGIDDLEFLTFDNGRAKTDESDPGTKSLSLLALEDYADGITEHPDVAAAIALRRVLPQIRNPPLPNMTVIPDPTVRSN